MDEYLFTRGFSDTTGDWGAVPHRVVKRTRTRIYLDRQSGKGDPPDIRRCFVIDRQTLERDGKVYVPSRGETVYQTEEAACQ